MRLANFLVISFKLKGGIVMKKMPKMRWWIIFVVITLTITSSVSIAFYHNLYNSNIELIQAKAEEMDTLNRQLEDVTDLALEVIANNKQWRLDSLYTNKMQREEFQNFLDACIIEKDCTTTIVAEVNQRHTGSIRAEIKTSQVFKNDKVQSIVLLEFDYSYNLVKMEYKLHYKQSYVEKEIQSLQIMSICVGLFSSLAINLIVVAIFRKKAVKS